MKKISWCSGLIMGIAVAAAAHGGGMGGGGGQMGSGGAGMLTVADDGSLLVTEMSSMMGGGPGDPGGGMGGDDRALVNIAPDGTERWRATFAEGWPMTPVDDGNLVVFALRDDWWDGSGTGGDGGWNHGGGHGGGGGGGGGGPHADSVVVVGLDLGSGSELWRTTVEGEMASAPLFAPDGSRFYLTVRDFDTVGGGLGNGPMHQGDAPGAHQLMSTSLVAIGRDGAVLWRVELAAGGHKNGGIR